VPHGTESRYYPNGILQYSGTFVQGKKEGAWMVYDEEGKIKDSAVFTGGRVKGVQLKWYRARLTDSLAFDGAGNGVQKIFREGGKVFMEGPLVSDTARIGRWSFFHPNGRLMAVAQYAAGKRIDCDCFDEKGKQLPAAVCTEEEAEYPGGLEAWSKFVSSHLDGAVPVRKNAPLGYYTVLVQFIVDTEGRVTGITPLTRFGYGMEKEVVRMLKLSPRWKPAFMFGRKVNAYRKQPITFVVAQG
jgi:hypothetical protein